MALRSDASFPDTANLVATDADASEFISDLTRTFAGVYLANSNSWPSVITFVHSVTGPSALRLLLPHVPKEEAPGVLRHGWHAAAGLYSAFATGGPVEAADEDIDREDLIDRSIATKDEHAIKFTEACLRENIVRPDPVYLAAAAHAAEFLRGDKYPRQAGPTYQESRRRYAPPQLSPSVDPGRRRELHDLASTATRTRMW